MITMSMSNLLWAFCPNPLRGLARSSLWIVVGTPGAGFGKMGEGYFRLTAFGSRENTIEAMERMEKGL